MCGGSHGTLHVSPRFPRAPISILGVSTLSESLNALSGTPSFLSGTATRKRPPGAGLRAACVFREPQNVLDGAVAPLGHTPRGSFLCGAPQPPKCPGR